MLHFYQISGLYQYQRLYGDYRLRMWNFMKLRTSRRTRRFFIFFWWVIYLCKNFFKHQKIWKNLENLFLPKNYLFQIKFYWKYYYNWKILGDYYNLYKKFYKINLIDDFYLNFNNLPTLYNTITEKHLRYLLDNQVKVNFYGLEIFNLINKEEIINIFELLYLL